MALAEHALTLAMLSDAADEAMSITRLCNTETADSAALHTELSRFLRRIDVLFVAGKCTEVPGYTSLMLDVLSRVRVWILPAAKGRTKVIRSIGVHGGVPAEMVERCMNRLRCWLRLARSALEAEFPSFELVQAACQRPSHPPPTPRADLGDVLCVV